MSKSLAVDLSMSRRRKMSRGGPCEAHGMEMCKMCHGGKMMAEGGEAEDPTQDPMYQDWDDRAEHEREADEETSRMDNMEEHEGESAEDMVGRILAKHMKHYSEGGRVANDTKLTAGFEDNEFDDLPKDDDLEEHYTGANSGDELGDDQEDMDRRDIVSRIMKNRRLRDKGGSGSRERIA